MFAKLLDFQRDATDLAYGLMNAALFAEQGTGKTWMMMGLLERLDYELEGEVDALGVVNLNNLETSWMASIAEHLPQYTICRTMAAFRMAPQPRLLLVHWEAIGRNEKLVRSLLRRRWSAIFADESQRAKKRTSRQSRALARLVPTTRRRVILSGTPMDEEPIDLWAQFRFVDPDILGTWKEFTRKFCRKAGPMKRQWVFRKRRLKEFIALIAPWSVRITKDILDLPPLRLIHDPITLRGEAREVYERLERRWSVKLEDSRVTAELKITLIGKLHQICGGFVIDDDGDSIPLHETKIGRVRSIMGRHKSPFVIFCRYTHEAQLLYERLSPDYRVAVFTGKTRKIKRPQIIRDFQAGLYDAIICQVKTGGVGIDLYRSSRVIVYSTGYSYIDFDQAIARTHRMGQLEEVWVFLVYARNTIDEAVVQAILSKYKVIRKVLDYLKRRKPLRWAS